jgi:recombination protein RecA
MSDFQASLRAINKKLGLAIMPANKRVARERILTGIPNYDVILGGGFPVGTMQVIKGEFSSGKSLVAHKTAAAFQRHCRNCKKPMFHHVEDRMEDTPILCCKKPEPMRVLWVDVEDSFDPDWAKRLGMNVDATLLAQTAFAEDTVDIVTEMLQTREVDLVILDSVAELSPSAEVSDPTDKSHVGVLPRIMNRAMRKWNAVLMEQGMDNSWKSSIILLNQIRLKIGVMYGDPETSPGGKGIDFTAKIGSKIRRVEYHGQDDLKTGITVAILNKKNKTAQPMRSCSFTIAFNDMPELGLKAGGSDATGQIFRMASYWGLIERRGANYRFTKGGIQYKGKEAAIRALSQPELEKVREALFLEVLRRDADFRKGAPLAPKKGKKTADGEDDDEVDLDEVDEVDG